MRAAALVAAVCAFPSVALSQQPPSATQADSARGILYYEEVDGQQVLSGVYLDGRRVTIRADESTTMPMWSPDGAWVANGRSDQSTHSGVLELVNLRGERRQLFSLRDSLQLMLFLLLGVAAGLTPGILAVLRIVDSVKWWIAVAAAAVYCIVLFGMSWDGWFHKGEASIEKDWRVALTCVGPDCKGAQGGKSGVAS